MFIGIIWLSFAIYIHGIQKDWWGSGQRDA